MRSFLLLLVAALLPLPLAAQSLVATTVAAGEAGAPAARAQRVRVPVTVTRWDGRSAGPVLSGVPLPPGALRAGEENRLQLHVDGRPQRIFAAALPSTHPDGSLRAVLVGGELPVGRGTLLVGDAPRPTELSLPPGQAPLPDGVPAGALLPSDPDYLVSTLLVGPTITVADARARGERLARYERDFVAKGNRLWEREQDERGGNYYDRALIWFTWWARTGDPEYWRRGVRQAHRYRVDYLEANNYGSSPRMAQLEGVQLHYLLTGDPLSRTAVGATAAMLHRSVQRRDGFGDTLTQQGENRQLARVLQAQLLAWRLGAHGPRVGDDWAPKLDALVDAVLRMQSPDGAWRFQDICGGGLNYMDGMLADALVEVHRVYRADPRIPRALARHAEWLWRTQWDPQARAFDYATVECKGVGGPRPAEDVLGLHVNEFAWLYAQTGDAIWRQRAEAILDGMIGEVWLDGTKQFNQQYTLSPRALWYLHGGRDGRG